MIAPRHQVIVAQEQAVPRHNEFVNGPIEFRSMLDRQLKLFDVKLIGETA